MLMLSRKKGQKILIHPAGVEIFVSEIKGSRVVIGISAPDGETIIRDEHLKQQRSSEDDTMGERKISDQLNTRRLGSQRGQ